MRPLAITNLPILVLSAIFLLVVPASATDSLGPHSPALVARTQTEYTDRAHPHINVKRYDHTAHDSSAVARGEPADATTMVSRTPGFRRDMDEPDSPVEESQGRDNMHPESKVSRTPGFKRSSGAMDGAGNRRTSRQSGWLAKRRILFEDV